MSVELFTQHVQVPAVLQKSLLQLESEITYPMGETQRFAVFIMVQTIPLFIEA